MISLEDYRFQSLLKHINCRIDSSSIKAVEVFAVELNPITRKICRTQAFRHENGVELSFCRTNYSIPLKMM